MKLICRRWEDARGSVAPIFAVVLTTVLGFVGVAIDFGRLYTERVENQIRLDAATLAAVVEGTDSQAQERFEAAMKAKTLDPARATFKRTLLGTVVSVETSYDSTINTTFSRVLGFTDMRTHANSSASAPLRVNEFEIIVDAAYGWYNKDVDFKVRHTDNTVETIATISYRSTNMTALNGRGIGTVSVSPGTKIAVLDYARLWVEMRVHNIDSGNTEVLSTDDPSTVDHLFINGRQFPAGRAAELTSLMPCGETAKYGWEDGGNFSLQDFFFDVKVSCSAPDPYQTRLTK